MSALLALAERCEKASGPDRELDLAIHLALDPEGSVARVIASSKRGLNQRLGQSWELKERAVFYETWNEEHCWANGAIPVACYTASIDAAMTLYTTVGTDYLLKSTNDLAGHRAIVWAHNRQVGFDADAATPALALCCAALRARDSDASLAEDAKRLSPEGVAARAEGIAHD